MEYHFISHYITIIDALECKGLVDAFYVVSAGDGWVVGASCNWDGPISSWPAAPAPVSSSSSSSSSSWATSSNVSRVDREELSPAVDGPTAQMGGERPAV